MDRETKKEIHNGLWGLALTALITLSIVLLLLACAGCSPKVVTRERTVTATDTVTEYIALTDTLRLTERVYESDVRYDSIAPILDSLNRVIGWDRWHYRESTKKDEREMARLRAVVDSFYRASRDTVREFVPQPYPVEKIVKVEKPRSWWLIGLAAAGGIVLLIVIVAVLSKVGRRSR